MSRTAEVLIPASVDEAVSAFGDGSGVTVIGGGTIVMPEFASGRTSVSKALILSRAGLAGIVRDGGTVKIGAATPLEALVGATPDPLSTAAQRVGDYEIRGQATIGGNLCAGPGRETPLRRVPPLYHPVALHILRPRHRHPGLQGQLYRPYAVGPRFSDRRLCLRDTRDHLA